MSVDDILDHMLPDDWREQPHTSLADMRDEKEGTPMAERLDTPREARRPWWTRPKTRGNEDSFGHIAEAIARFMGTPKFLFYMTVFCAAWLIWNSWGPIDFRFDKAANGFTALTLMLSIQASYSAPLILLAQNRQADRDRVAAEQDRQRAERNLSDTEYLAREMASLRIAMGEVATRDFVRSELRVIVEELQRSAHDAVADRDDEQPEDDTPTDSV